MKLSQTYHLNDKTLKYMSFAQSKRQHQYLNLPGEYDVRLPQEMVFTDMTSARGDEIYYNNEDLLIDLEEESEYISPKTLEKFSKYAIFICYWYLKRKLYLAVICHKNPKKESECFEYAPSLYIKVHYIYFEEDSLWEKYENIINKVEHNETLTDTEALDIAFTSKFISKKDAPEVIEKLCEAFRDAQIEDKGLRLDVKVILGGMILKHVQNQSKQKRLMEVIGMREIKNELDELLYEEYGDKLDAKDKEINNLKKSNEKYKRSNQEYKKSNQEYKKSNEKYKKQIEKLNELDDLNTPEARKILSSLKLL